MAGHAAGPAVGACAGGDMLRSQSLVGQVPGGSALAGVHRVWSTLQGSWCQLQQGCVCRYEDHRVIDGKRRSAKSSRSDGLGGCNWAAHDDATRCNARSGSQNSMQTFRIAGHRDLRDKAP